MKRFYLRSYWFWLLSKSLLIIALLLVTLDSLGNKSLGKYELALSIVGLIEAFLLMATLSQDYYFLKKYYFLKIIAGSILILFGISLFTYSLTVSEGSQSAFFFWYYPLSVYLILIGLFDVLRVKKFSP